ncbi:hypothetical protein [Bacillus zhangzhouensis]|uniref:hypothetical protein n=1 Tax=Bacillus zhangzhouensis TaxID=1178540 RepID=UPI00068D9D1E|nr:hypothetical protein [Bacillus zhangzhouensis]
MQFIQYPLGKIFSILLTGFFYINTYMKMLNKLEERKLPNIKAGIGSAAKETLAVKSGRKSSGMNNLV